MPQEKTDFSNSKTAHQWLKIGKKRRAGVLVPLFSIYSQNSVGIGEIPDIKLLVDWCTKVNISIIQLLPLNDTGYNFSPYDAESSYALDPMYLSLSNIYGLETNNFKNEIDKLRRKFNIKNNRVNYEIKHEKLKLLKKMFDSTYEMPSEFEEYKEKNKYWLRDYAIYKTIKDKFKQNSWEKWADPYKNLDNNTSTQLIKTEYRTVVFYEWLQWQLYIQMTDLKEYADEQDVFIMGDLPLLVSKDSADVWSKKEYYILDKCTGTPLDFEYIKGQRWGMPPYNWVKLENRDFNHIKERLKYAENFYDIYRIDHFMGLFRLWVIDNKSPIELGGFEGKYIPENPELWETQGLNILNKMLESTSMLPCGENLGDVPECANNVLNNYLIPGLEIQRWTFKHIANKYNNISMLSTHDTSTFIDWWGNECGTINSDFIKKLCDENELSYKSTINKLFDINNSAGKRLGWKENINTKEKMLKTLNLPFEKSGGFEYAYLNSYGEKQKFLEFLQFKELPEKNASKTLLFNALKKSLDSNTIFSIQSILDWLELGDIFNNIKKSEPRINIPGTISGNNWTFAIPVPLEKFLDMTVNKTIIDLNRSAHRT